MLSAIYIKGFKTFARPVRMPLEGGITAIVGPNGSGKSNITDAVLFALGEQSPGVLRAGAMSELVFSGSETLPAARAAEVTLVLENASGGISLPYREVSVTRRISRDGETEYRINGARARLQDVKAVAGEAGIGRHSILRQGAVDAIVAGGASACRLALEEAAGLGVFRRRRLSASRRLERADAQLEKTRHLEAELASQLRRIEREAAAAREYRELEARYRELSLAHLYRVATGEPHGLRTRLREAEARVAELGTAKEKLDEEEGALARRLETLEDRLRDAEELLEALEDAAEELRAGSGRLDRVLFRAEAGWEDARLPSVSRLEGELDGVSAALGRLQQEVGAHERERAARHEALKRARRVLEAARERSVEAERERSRLAGRLESVRARLAREATPLDRREPLSDGELELLSEATERVLGSTAGDVEAGLGELRETLEERAALLDARTEEMNRRRGALAAAVGRAESRIRALQAPRGSGTRLYEVLRARPGYEVAVEAALGEFGAGVLAGSVDEGMRLLSRSERVVVRLDAREMEENGSPPGRPLVECIEVVDGRYAEAIQRLLAGIYVTEDPQRDAPANGYVAVTRDGLRLTRTSVSFTPGEGRLAREARLSAERERLEALKSGPGEEIYDLRETLGQASSRLEQLSEIASTASVLAERASRARALIVREARRRRAAAEASRERALERESRVAALSREERELAEALVTSEETCVTTRRELASAASAADSARAAAADSDRLLDRLRAAADEGRDRHARLSGALERLRGAPVHDPDHARQTAGRAQAAAARLSAAVRERRSALREIRASTADRRRRASGERAELARRATDLAAALASARADAERLASELRQADSRAQEAAVEIASEWGATLEDARREADRNPPDAGQERSRLARRLKRFGDVNLLALSQQEELQERYRFVSAQRADAEAAASQLNRIIQEIDREIEARFSATFERVRAAFGEIVPRMMEGSSGVLELSEEGVEVGLRLGRRGWKPLRVLSGGERALLALSFLFSIFLSRPEGEAGAFCVLDEAEAALDDLNLARFLAVVDSHRAEGQYLLVTHQKRTMAAADVLYGVVQDASGATTVVSKRLQGE